MWARIVYNVNKNWGKKYEFVGCELSKEDLFNDSTIITCKTCLKINKKYGTCEPNSLGYLDITNTGVPRLRRIFQYPHPCTMNVLKQVQHLYNTKCMDRDLFTKWMSKNGGCYQLGNSSQCMSLWSEVSTFKADRSDRDSYGIKASLTPGFVVVKCETHGLPIVKINWKRLQSRKDVKAVNTIWQFSSEADKAKTVIDVASLLFHIKLHKIIDSIDSALTVT